MTTPAGVTVMARAADGTEVDITQGVMTLYDIVIQSMDWGSGMLDTEEAETVVHVATTCGFANWQEARRYVTSQAQSKEQQEFMRGHEWNEERWRFFNRVDNHAVPHDHVWSSVGRCVWPLCKADTWTLPEAGRPKL